MTWHRPSSAMKVIGRAWASQPRPGQGGQAELWPHTQGPPALMAPGGRSSSPEEPPSPPPQVARASSVGDTEHLAEYVDTSAERPLGSKLPQPGGLR